MRYAISLAEQGFASILNLALSLWMIRQVGAAEYGVFVLWNNVALILSSVQNALIVCHLQALPPGRAGDAWRRAPERLLLGVNTLLMAGCAVACLVASWIGGGALLAPWAVAAFVPGFLLYQYARALAFTRGAVMAATATTAAVLVLAVVLFAASRLAGVRPRADVALELLAVVYGVVGAVSLWRLTPGARVLLPWREVRGYRAYAVDSVWVLLGVGSAEIVSRFYSFVVAAWFGPAALGTLSAAQVLLRPAILAVNAWGWVARAEMAGSREAGDWRRFLTSLGRGIVGVLLVSLPWAFCVYEFWPLASRVVFGGRFADVGWIALLWGVSAAVGGVQSALSVSLQALRAFRRLAVGDLISAAGVVAATLWLMAWLGYPYAVAGLILGQVLGVVALATILWRIVRTHRSPALGGTMMGGST